MVMDHRGTPKPLTVVTVTSSRTVTSAGSWGILLPAVPRGPSMVKGDRVTAQRPALDRTAECTAVEQWMESV